MLWRLLLLFAKTKKWVKKTFLWGPSVYNQCLEAFIMNNTSSWPGGTETLIIQYLMRQRLLATTQWNQNSALKLAASHIMNLQHNME